MTMLPFVVIIYTVSVAAGLLGSLTGIGGGAIVISVLTLAFGVDIRYAIGASLISVIATSSGAAASYVKEGYTNIRIGMFLEVATVFGALAGAFLATILHTSTIAIIFGVILILSSHDSIFNQHNSEVSPAAADPIATRLRMDSSYPTSKGMKSYHVKSVPLGFGMMLGAGAISGLLGIGSGVIKVLAMDKAMRIPFKVSTTTSNFMMGVTAAASAGIYLSRGYIEPAIAMPVLLGVLTGASLGSKQLPKTKTRTLKIIFGIVIFIIALEMVYKGMTRSI